VRRFLALLVVALLAAGVAIAVRRLAPSEKIVHTATTVPPVVHTEIVPAPGQSLVGGTVQTFSADGAVSDPIPAPFTINAVERGAVRNATIEGAIVGGSRQTIYWDAGTPMPISGGGALDLGPAHVDVDTHGVTWALVGAPRPFRPGRYHVGSPVAVGSGGLATPRDNGVDFTADERTVLVTTAGVVIHLDQRPVTLEGPGTLAAGGRFLVRTQSGQRQAGSIMFGPGPFRVAFTPDPAGLTIDATLQGPVTAK
jgi:hypothetical protein